MGILGTRSFRRLVLVSCHILVGASICFPQSLRDTSNQADYIVVAPTAFMSAAADLAAFRHARDGYATMVVSFDSIRTQFNTGAAGDTSLRSFIRYALQSWKSPAVKYLVLAGNVGAIPSHVVADEISIGDGPAYDSLSVDEWFVQAPSDGGSFDSVRISIGRLPAWDSAGLSVMIKKQIAYETGEPAGWWNRSIGLADYDTLTGGWFEDEVKGFQEQLGQTWNDTVTVHVEEASPLHRDPAGFLALWNEGAALMTYNGHANPFTLSATRYFTPRSVDSLTNGSRLPLCLFGGCNLRYDTRDSVSISVHLLDHPDGGAVACIVSTGYMFESYAVGFLNEFIRLLRSDPTSSVGQAFVSAKNNLQLRWLQRFTFLGDPAIHLKRPEKPTAVIPGGNIPSTPVLYQNYPNPFNPTTEIQYTIHDRQSTSLKVFDLLGREVATLVNEVKTPGTYTVKFDGSGLASGVYLCRLRAGGFAQTRKLLLLR